jgi:membrane-anchored glycerophosphoryl diester phosphodiesterase (GDPDase)
MRDKLEKLAPYLQALPGILQYQVFTKIVITLWLFLMGRVYRILLNSMGRVAVSTGDFTFLFGHWQGILILLVALVSLYGYVAIDLNAKVILSRDLLSGEKISAWSVLKRAFPTIGRFVCLAGFGVILYIALIAPVLGFGVSLTLTKGFYIPTFISSVIADTPLFLVAVSILMLVFLSVGVANLFILHGVVLDGLPVNEAGKQSRQLIRVNWKDYLKQNLLFLLVILALLAAAVLVLLVLPLALVQLLPLSAPVRRALTVFFLTSGVLLSALFQRYVPQTWMVRAFGGNEAWGVLMAATIGVPLYACGGGTIPLLQSWLAEGMSLGSAAAFMITGPATKITNLGALKICMGWRRFWLYLGFVMMFSLLSGLLINLVL